MSFYYNLSLSHRVCNEILEAIETAVEHTDGFNEIYELIQLYDHIEEEMNESSKKQDKELRRWIEQQEMFVENNVEDIFKFNKIKAVLHEYDVEMDAEDEFHLICDLSDVIKNE